MYKTNDSAILLHATTRLMSPKVIQSEWYFLIPPSIQDGLISSSNAIMVFFLLLLGKEGSFL